MRGNLTERFMAKVRKDPGGCWVWTASARVGYGCISVGGRNQIAHRVAYELFVGPIPRSAVVMHTCDRPRCVNPAHLRVGTQADNLRDASAKGRTSGGAKGERHHQAKLTASQVATLRDLLARPMRRGERKILAAQYGIHRSTLGRIKRGELWKEST